MKFCAAVSLLLSCAYVARAANILFYFGVSTYSHRNSVWPLVLSLANSGHHVTFMNVYAPKPEHVHPNVTEFFPHGDSPPLFGNPVNARLEGGQMGAMWAGAGKLPELGLQICNDLLSSPETAAWITRSSFDLVFIDACFNECGLGLAHVFNAKVIIFGPTTVFSWWHDAFGFPAETNWVADMIIPFQFPMSFRERVFNTFMPLIQYNMKYWDYFPKMDKLFAEKLNASNIPSVRELERDTSMIFVSTHYTEEFARSLPPFLVPIGGIHMETAVGQDVKQQMKPVPGNIQKWMDESGPEGFIYVSFGSASFISGAPEHVQQKFYTAFRNTKQRILWKWETDSRPPGMPSNVLTAKWMPQHEILTHPNVKAFVTHGGLMGLTESLTNGVPVVIFPIFAEQDYNALRYEREERGIRLEITTLTSDELEEALREIVDNPKYKRNMLTAKQLFADRPASPLQTALWWTEYVLRHDRKELKRLKPLAMSQWWFQRRLLDVWAFVALVSGITLMIVAYSIKILVKAVQIMRRGVQKVKTS